MTEVTRPSIRNYVFVGDNSYDIDLTMERIRRIFTDQPEDRMPLSRRDAILVTLQQMKHYVDIPFDYLIQDAWLGDLMPWMAWFNEFGVEDPVEWAPDDVTIETFPLTDEEFELENEENIDPEAESAIIFLANRFYPTNDEEFDYLLEEEHEHPF